MSEPKKTPRGFIIYDEVENTYGKTTVQESSVATGPFVWIFTRGGDALWTIAFTAIIVNLVLWFTH